MQNVNKWGDEKPTAWARTEKRLKVIRKNLTKSDAEIGKMFGVTRAAIFELRMRYDIPKVRSNTQHKAEADSAGGGKLPPGLTITQAAGKIKAY